MVQQFNSYHTRELILHLGKEQKTHHTVWQSEDALSLFLSLSLPRSTSFSHFLSVFLSLSISIYQITCSFALSLPFSLCFHVFSLYLSPPHCVLSISLFCVLPCHSLIYTYNIHTQFSSFFSLVPYSHGAVLVVSQLWAELGWGCQLQDYDRAPAALCMEVSRWGKNGLQPGTMDGGMEGWIMDGEMEERNTVAICVSPNWRLALAHTSEAQGQVTKGDSASWGCCEKAQDSFNQ